jgi:nitrogen fixation NifU-like protein
MTQDKVQGGAMAGVDELYREVILDHFKTPRNKGVVESANAKADGVNPLCGDQISVTALVEHGKVQDIKFQGHGCAISQSAASMMTAAVKGKSVEDARGLSVLFKKMFGVETAPEPASHVSAEDMGDMEALEGVKKYPVRIKCALLSWNTMLESLSNLKK